MRLSQLLEFTTKPPTGAIVTLPFANQETLDWLGKGYITLAYANQPRTSSIFHRDVFTNSPKFNGAYVIAQPPWTHKNDSENKTIYDHYGTDNLYKCFIKMIVKDCPLGGSIIIPLNFLTGMRDSERSRRAQFFKLFEVNSITIFSDELIDNMIPIVIDFQRWTDYAKFQNTIKVKMVDREKVVDRVWNIDHSQNSLFIKESNPFLSRYMSAPTKKITTQMNSYSQNGLYLSKLYPYYLSTEAKEDTTKIEISGFISNRLKLRIVNDFNSWLKDWLQSTNGIFLPFVTIDGQRVSTIQTELVSEAIKRIIWSYYKPE